MLQMFGCLQLSLVQTLQSLFMILEVQNDHLRDP